MSSSQVGAYVSSSHSKTSLRFHFVFVSKYRYDCFVGVETVVGKCFVEDVAKCDKVVSLLAFVVDKNHVHCVVQCSPDVSIS